MLNCCVADMGRHAFSLIIATKRRKDACCRRALSTPSSLIRPWMLSLPPGAASDTELLFEDEVSKRLVDGRGQRLFAR